MGTMPPPSDIVKVAIEWPGANAQLLEIDQVSSWKEDRSRNAGGRGVVREAHGRVVFRNVGFWHQE